MPGAVVTMPDGTQVQMPEKMTDSQRTRLARVQARSAQITESRRDPSDKVGPRRKGEGGPKFYKDYPDLPFLDRTVVATMLDRPDKGEAKSDVMAYLERKYGKGSVNEDNRGLTVKVGDRTMRVNTGVLAEVTSKAPETTLGIAGAVAGSPGGPVGSVAGAAAGGFAGRAIKETALAAERAKLGRPGASPGEVVKNVGVAGAQQALGELGARGVGGVVGRATRGPIPRSMTDTFVDTPGMSGAEREAMIRKTTAAGARPPPTSTMPGAKKIQRIAIIADKIVGANPKIDRANMGYLTDRVDSILTKAGVNPSVKADAMKRLEVSTSSLSTQETGKLIQQTVRQQLAGVAKSKSKSVAYLKTLVDPKRSPEDAFNWLVHESQTDRLERFVQVMGKNSTVVHEVQVQALRHVLAGALQRMESASAEAVGEGIGGNSAKASTALMDELSRMTPKQQKLLFPNGLDKDLLTLAKEIHFLYPGVKDPAMAGFTAGKFMQLVWYDRFWAQGVYATLRGLMQKPNNIVRLSVGFQGNSIQRAASMNALREMIYFGAIEGIQPQRDPNDMLTGVQVAAQHKTAPQTSPPVDKRRGVIRREAPSD